MIPRTRPLPVLLSLPQSRVNRIPLHISNGGKQMTLVHWIGMEALLPQMTPPTFMEIDHPRISAMRFSERARELSFLTGRPPRVTLIPHQTPFQELQRVGRSGL